MCTSNRKQGRSRNPWRDGRESHPMQTQHLRAKIIVRRRNATFGRWKSYGEEGLQGVRRIVELRRYEGLEAVFPHTMN
jgi:hypothetical protein